MPSNISEMRAQIAELRAEIGKAAISFKQFESVVFRSMTLIKRFTGNEDVDKAIHGIQRLIVVMRQLQIASAALMSASPFGLILFGVAGLSAMLMMSDSYYEANNR